VTGAQWAVKPGKRKKNKAIFTAFVLVEEHDKSGRFSPRLSIQTSMYIADYE
jgi:hypothetical protein